MRRKIANWEGHADTVTRTRAAARKLHSGLKLAPGEWQRLPDYVHPALKAIEAEQSLRLSDPHRPSVDRWCRRFVWHFRPGAEVEWRAYKRCWLLRPGVFTDASFAALKRAFETLPSPEQLWKFLVDYKEEHKPSDLPEQDRRHRNLALTDAARQHLLSAKTGNGLTEEHERIAHTLASWPHAYGQAAHSHLAHATGTSVRTVRRALPLLRASGLLPNGRGTTRIRLAEQVPHFQQAMAAIAARAGCSVKTLYRWEQQHRCSNRSK